MSVSPFPVLGFSLVLVLGSATIQEAGPESQGPGMRDGVRGYQTEPGPVALFTFDGSLENGTGLSIDNRQGGDFSFGEGLEGEALSFHPGDASPHLALETSDLPLGDGQDFSVQFWMRTVPASDDQFVVLSQKRFPDNSLASQ